MKFEKTSDSKIEVVAGNLIVGSGVVITGVMNVPNEMEICGQVDGEIRVRTLKVGIGGQVKAVINCENAEINGEVGSQLICRNNLVLKEKAVLSGDVSYVNMEMNLGAELNAKTNRLHNA